MLTAEELAAYRATQEAAMPAWATIGDRTATSDGAGGETVAFVDRPVAVPVRVGEARDRDLRILADRLDGSAAATLTFPYGTALKERDRVIVGSKTFYVAHAPPVGTWDTARRVLAVEG